MKPLKRVIYVERGKGRGNFSCFCNENIGNYGLGGFGRTAREAMDDVKEVIKEYKEMEAAEGREFPDVELDYRLDVGSFFDYYPIDITAFAKYIGMNASILRQYIAALRVPREAQVNRIREGIRCLSNDLVLGLPLEQPVVSK